MLSCSTVMLNVLFAWNNKNEGVSWRPENTWSYLTRKAHLTGKILWNCEPNYQQKLEQVETKIKKFCRHDQTEVVFFFFAEQEKAPLCTGGAIPLRLAFPQKLLQKRWIALRHIDQCLPPISSGWVVVGFWTKMNGRLEWTFLESFFSICSSKL